MHKLNQNQAISAVVQSSRCIGHTVELGCFAAKVDVLDANLEGSNTAEEPASVTRDWRTVVSLTFNQFDSSCFTSVSGRLRLVLAELLETGK